MNRYSTSFKHILQNTGVGKANKNPAKLAAKYGKDTHNL